jgi:pimeloyl-ACP methyl ester carboxylesterase
VDYLEFPGFENVFIPWLRPLKNEAIEEHARRLSAVITEPNPILVGLSFGGILAIEVAKILAGAKLILISSMKTRSEVPYYFRLAGKMQLHRLLPIRLLKWSSPVTYWLFGVRRSAEKKVLKDVLKNTDSFYLRWAFAQIVNWSNRTVRPEIIHIHGLSDHLLPVRFVKADKKITGGGHLMVMTHAAQVNRLLKEILI